MSGKKPSSGKITLGMLRGKSITTSVPSFAIRFHPGGEELEDIYPSAEDSDDEAEKPGVSLGIKKEDAGSLSDSATQSAKGTTIVSSLSASTSTTASATTTSMVSGTPSVTITSAPSRDPSPMKEYLKGLGKRSTSMDAGMMDTSSGSDTWRIFHELKGKITKTVEEKFNEKFSDKKPSSESRRGRLGSGSSKSKENSSISDEEMSEQSGQRTVDPKQTPLKSDSSPKKTIEDKKSLSFEERDEVLSDSLTDPPSTSSAVDISDVTDISSQGLVKKSGFRSKMKHNLSGLRNRNRAASAPVAGIKMSSLSASAENDLEGATDSDIEPAVEASEETGFLSEQLIDVDRTIPTTDYRTSVPTSHPPLERPKKYKRWFCIFTKLWSSKLILLGVLFCIYSVFYTVPPSATGFFLGALLVYVYFSVREMIRNLVAPRTETTTERRFSSVPVHASIDLPILEVPAVKEYQPLTKYEGWMNEYPDAYDPETYSITATQTVYVRLEGSTLRISHTRLKIPKRAMWNERKHKLRFSHQRIYNIANCCVKLLPQGLTRRRLWSKKYPICVILLKTSRCRINVMKESPTDETSQRTGFDSDGFDVQSQGSDIMPDSKSDWDESSLLETKSGEMKLDDDEMSVPGDVSDEDTFCHIDKTALEETCIYLFARTDREKEDWYRRLVAAVKFHGSGEEEGASSIQSSPAHSQVQSPVGSAAPFCPVATVTTATTAASSSSSTTTTATVSESSRSAAPGPLPDVISEQQPQTRAVELPEDLPIYPSELEDECFEYLKFMSAYQLQVLTAMGIRVLKHAPPLKTPASPNHSKRGKQKIEEDICNSIEKDVAPNLMWLNAFLGRILFDLMRNPVLVSKLQERIQKKLSAIRLPPFVGEILVSDIDIGETVPLIHCASRPMLDERGIWVNIDVTYKGNASLTLETKLNLMKLKKEHPGEQSPAPSSRLTSPAPSSSAEKRSSPMFDSDLDDSAESSDDESDLNKSSTDEEYVGSSAQNTGSTGKRILRMVNKIAASKFFEHATENKYIKRAMEEVSNTRIILSVEVKALSGTLTLNVPPPPSDRLWYGFRGCPQLALTARPKFGERQVNISHVVTWIEKQLIKEFQKKLVLPNMDDLVIGPMKDTLPK